MASAVDSGVDTGNDSNDSSAQDKLCKMDLENCQQAKLSESSIETSQEKQKDQNQPHSSSPLMVDSVSSLSFSHIQPSSLMHGYEYHFPPLPSNSCGKNFMMVKMMNAKDIGGGGPFGTEFKASDLVMKMRRTRTLRLKCLRHTSSQTGVFTYNTFIGITRMGRAVIHNNTEAMKRMLDAGLSPNCRDTFNRTPLHLAVCKGYADMVKLLLEYGADPNAKDNIGNTPLHLAACTNHVNVITLLLQAGTRVSEQDMAGHSPLQLAITKFNIIKRSVTPHPDLEKQVCEVISMLTEYMRRKEGPTIDPDLLTRFETLVRVSDSSEQVENNVQNLLSDLNSLSLSGTS